MEKTKKLPHKSHLKNGALYGKKFLPDTLAYISQIHFALKKIVVPCPHKATFFTMSTKIPLLIALFSFFSISLFAQKYADCDSAAMICHKSQYAFTKCHGEGKNTKEALHIECFLEGDPSGNAEMNSTWLKFKIKEAGNLMFMINPLDSLQDIDFVVFKYKEKGSFLGKKKVVRCMSSGGPEGLGMTGLLEGDKDTEEGPGFFKGYNNCLKPLDTEADDCYVLLVSNVTSDIGFVIAFWGTAKLECEE